MLFEGKTLFFKGKNHENPIVRARNNGLEACKKKGFTPPGGAHARRGVRQLRRQAATDGPAGALPEVGAWRHAIIIT